MPYPDDSLIVAGIGFSRAGQTASANHPGRSIRFDRYSSSQPKRREDLYNGGMPADEVTLAFLEYSVARLHQLRAIVSACCGLLTDEQMAHRGAEHENSIKNLLLHMTGNLRQWIVHGVGGAPDIRERDAEFALEDALSTSEVLLDFDLAVGEAMHIIASATPLSLLTVIDPQPTGRHRHPTVLVAIYKAVGHVEHHTAQIIVLTKQMVGRDLDLSMPRKH